MSNKVLEQHRDLPVNTVPQIVVYKRGAYMKKSKKFKKGEYKVYEDMNDKERFMHFFNNFLNPFVVLKTHDEMDKFLDLDNEYVEQDSEFFGHKKILMGSAYSL